MGAPPSLLIIKGMKFMIIKGMKFMIGIEKRAVISQKTGD
jgi:hypothetical protein